MIHPSTTVEISKSQAATRPDAQLFLSDVRGIHIPRDFALVIKRECISGVDTADLDYLALGADQEHYWETWQTICDNAVITDDKGHKFRVYQDGDCWLVPVGMEITDQGGFAWPDPDPDPCPHCNAEHAPNPHCAEQHPEA